MLAKILAIEPNRVALYVTALANALGALIPVLTDLGATDVVAPLVGINALCLMFLKGWQNMETADYQAQLMARQFAGQAEQAAAVSRPGSRIAGLPR